MSLSLMITIGVTVFLAAITAGLFARNRGARTLLMGLGLTLIPPGLYLLGLTDLLVNGVLSIIDWAQRTVFDTPMLIGAVLLGLGLLMFLVSLAVRPRTREERRAPEVDRRREPAALRRDTTTGTTRTRTATQPVDTGATKPSAPAAAGGASDEDEEIEEILKRRGIM